MGLYKIEELIDNLKKYDDTIIILGKDVVSKENKMFKVDEESAKIFNRKTLYRKPELYWQFYFNYVYNSDRKYTEEEKAVAKLINTIGKDKIKIINDTTLDSYKEYNDLVKLDLSGNVNELTCVSGRHTLSSDNMAEYLMKYNFKCPVCNSVYKPTVLMYKEKYDPLKLAILENMISKKENETRIPNTHNLIFIGTDFDNDIIHDITVSFKALKAQYETEDEKFFLTMILDHDPVNIDRYEPDFSTTDTITDSIDRLVKLF